MTEVTNYVRAMSENLYGTWTIEDTKNVGAKFTAICRANYGYEDKLTNGKTYEIEVTPRILEMTPLCKTIGDKGRITECHLERFEKVLV